MNYFIMKKKKKKYLINQENDYNKKIKELFEKEENIIYIKGEFTNYFNLQLFWVSENNKQYMHKFGKEEKFHETILQFMRNNEEFEDYIITKIYIEPYNNQIIVSIGKNNINIPSNLITINNNSNNKLNSSKLNNKKYNIIESEFNYKYDTFQ